MFYFMFLKVYFRAHPPRLPLWFPAEGSDEPSIRVISREQVRAEERIPEAAAKAWEVDVGGRESGRGWGPVSLFTLHRAVVYVELCLTRGLGSEVLT